MSLRLFVFLGTAAGAAAALPPLSPDDAIRAAWRSDPAAAAFALAPELAFAREEQAGVRPNPDLELRGSLPVAGDSEWSVGVGLSQRLPRRDRVDAARSLARLDTLPPDLEARERRRIVAGEVRLLYYDTVVQQARRTAADRIVVLLREQQAALGRQLAAGETSAVEVELLGLELARATQAAGLAAAEATAASARLARRLRLPASAPPTLAADLDALLARPVPGTPAPLEHARPTLALAAHRVQRAEAALTLARTEARADWTVGAGLDFERRANDFTGRLESEPRLGASASLPWPRTVPNRGDLREKQAAVRLASAELAAARDELAAEIAAASDAALALHAAVVSHRTALQQLPALPPALVSAAARGELPSTALAQARRLRTEIETDFLAAAARFVTALAEAETAAGLVPAHP